MHKSIKRLAALSGATTLRFWGKIDCTGNDYFIVEGELPNGEESSTAYEVEERGNGVNKKVYWVTENIRHDWIQLPDAEPHYILAAQQIKHIMSGDLNADLTHTVPPFPGKERHFL